MTALDDGLAAIDAVNADDPNNFDGEPLAWVQGRLADRWVQELESEPSDELRLAARAHHIRRWAVPRSTYPEGRAGYLRWRHDQRQHHAEELGQIMRDLGFPEERVARAGEIVKKVGLSRDPEVQAFEDAVSLTFIQTQFSTTADKLADDDKMVDVVARTLRKMSPSGHAAAATIAVDDHTADLLARALEAAAG